MEPKDIHSTTWYLSKVRLRTWHHFPVIVKIEERDVKTKKGVKGWAGWIPRSGPRQASSKILCSAQAIVQLRHVKMSQMDWSLSRKDCKPLRPRSKPRRQLRGTGINSPCWMISGRWRLMQHHAETRSEGSCFGKEPAKPAESLKRVVPSLPRGKVIHRPVVTKLWMNGRASDHKDEWTEEVRAHCGKRLS